MKFKTIILILFLIIILIQGVNALSTIGINAYYKMDSSGGINDATGNHTNASIISATFTASGLINGGYSISNNNAQNINLGFASFTGSQTICLWVKADGSGDADQIISGDPSGYTILALGTYTGSCVVGKACFMTYGSAYDVVTSTSSYGTNWNFICGVHDQSAGKNKIYFNGTNEANFTYGAVVSGSSNPINIGGGATHDFGGTIDELQYWNKALSSDEIIEIYNLQKQGLSCGQYPGFNCGATSNFSVTALNSWDSSAINIFNLTMQSGATTYNFGTTTGTITTSLLTNDTSLWNLTYSSVGNYFNNNYININISSAHTGYLNQSIINISVKNIVDNSTITNYSIKFNSTTFCNTSTSNCLNNPLASFYNVNITPNDGTSFHSLNTNTTISALQNETIYFYVHTHQINITAKDSVTLANITNFTINIKSLNSTYETNYTTTNGLIDAFVIHETYNITIDANGYALYNNIDTLSITNDTNKTFYLQRNNGILINIYNEANGSLITDTNFTIYTFLNNTLIYTNTTNATITFYELIPGNYTLRFEAINYAVKEYYIEVGNRSFQVLNAYMLQTTYSTILTFTNEANGQVVEGVTLIIQKYINGSLEVISSLTSDITGRCQFSYQPNNQYYFTASKTYYTTKSFTLNPILFSSYNVLLTPTTTQTYESDYSGVTINYNPTSFNNNQINTLTFTFGSPQGKLNNYGFNITFNGLINSSSGVNSYGEVLSASLNITGASFQDTAQVIYYYTTSDGATNTHAFKIPINGASASNYTLFYNKGNTYGLGDFERILIITTLLIIVVGAGVMFSGVFVGGVLGMLILGFFAYMGFINWWITYPTLVFLFAFIVWGSSK